MSKDIKPVLNGLANLALALEDFVTTLVAYSDEMPDLLVSELQVQELLKRQQQRESDSTKEQQPTVKTPTDAAPTVTIEQVRKVLAEKSQNGKQPEVKALIASYGVRRLTEIDPAHYAEIQQRAEEL